VTAERVQKIRAVLEQAFTPQRLVVEDQSHLHAGHAGAATGRGHFHVEIVSQAFAGQPPIAVHRRVYEVLGDLMQTDIHALSLKARAPEDPSGRS
jgi:BolA family transcriptional regulator, general stress-responsive regulator